MNQHGAAGTTGYDAKLVVEYLDAHRVTVVRGGKPRKTLNGHVVDSVDARVIRRWRNSAKSVRRESAKQLFECYGLTVPHFERWLAKRR